MRATGIHILGNILRVLTLEKGTPKNGLIAIDEVRLPAAFTSEGLAADPEGRNRCSEHLKHALGTRDTDPGSVVASLGGGFYQIQKVPLEVAAEEDRKEQMVWEAAQALISPVQEYRIAFYPAGRVAFWVAIRHTVIDIHTELYASAGLEPEIFLVDPMALFCACEMTGLWATGQNAAILLGDPWATFVAADDGILTAAETVRTSDAMSLSQGVARLGSSILQERVRHWVFGDLAPDRRRTTYKTVYLSGNQTCLRQVFGSLAAAASPQLTPLQPFENLDTDPLAEAQRSLLDQSSAFGIAAGLASWKLENATPP